MTNYDLDANQLRAARVLLGWDLKVLSERSGISESTLKQFERIGLSGQFSTVRKVLETYAAAGIEFSGRGVNLKTPSEGAAA
jgi:transcriptional regulator with XRE-family HTH domain